MAVSPDQSGIADVTAAEAPRNLEGALWMTASGLVFTVFLTLSKVQSAEYDPGFLAFFRSFIALILTLPVIVQQGWGIMRIHQPGMVLLRSLFGTMGFIFGFYAVSAQFGLPLSEFNAISFSRAMFITVLAAVLLKETVGWHRWGATLAGFIGVLIMTQPQAGVSLGTLLALAAAFCMAGAITLVKLLSRRHRPVTLLIWANLLSSAMLLPLAIWKMPEMMPSWQDWALITLMGGCGVAGQYFYIRGMAIGDASFLSPIDYLRLPMAATVDWFLFKALPGPWTWAGTAIIIGATAYITLRERHVRRRARGA
ncbi:DMT family transporter [Hyphomonas jannaschiana]|uniref:Putative transporter n=1 Tax=Hyphomonas jannaschiana VP2 TaxID=1280952 RepID=A0A059F7Y4_9PROT|nr:DMT family transporter [Hyphomonas jannaschiana]KCZ86691.1 putative transporter [Hyphomonas jannaschiana VP2]